MSRARPSLLAPFVLALLVVRVADAQRAPRAPSARIAVARVEESSLRQARVVAPGFAERVARCVSEARTVDPAGVAAVSVATVVIRLRTNGAAEAVEIEPSTLARGLSACLGNALLEWRQGGRVGLRGNVQLVLSLEP